MKTRFRSALLGTALGDAWSYPYQLPPQSSATPLPERLQISDDTQMTLALSTAMRAIDAEKLDRDAGMREIGRQFLDYYGDPDYDRFPGASTTESLKRLKEKGTEQWSEVSTHSGGSGAVMRVSASALLAPSQQGVGWSVLQAILTHDSGVARASSAVVACMMMAEKGSDLIEVAGGIAGDKNFDSDVLLTSEEKSGILTDLDEALIKDLTGPDVPFTELVSRVAEVRDYLTPLPRQGRFRGAVPARAQVHADLRSRLGLRVLHRLGHAVGPVVPRSPPALLPARFPPRRRQLAGQPQYPRVADGCPHRRPPG
ncbi:ADP-ribosylglycohydrolase family protein [Corynebacterium falsenii]|uniref:ADP-ribosylglycohydrolase family protein n=1 Tax=Corynebacterium falsenii TaxID=108486 RepID=UPI003FD5B099